MIVIMFSAIQFGVFLSSNCIYYFVNVGFKDKP